MTVMIRIFGIVQGVGFRPFTANAARRHGITGTVANKGSYVEVFAKGEESDIKAFEEEFRTNAPERSVILGLNSAPCADFEDGGRFEIIESEKEYGDIFVSPDIATCPKCKRELFDKKDRRYLHPFINCTQCGPRVTILDTMPYDRERTSMAEFPMCKECAAEYHDPATRRYDAQPVCCNDCGPEVYVIGTELRGGEAITAVRKSIMSGKIAAVKGIGGFHLCCDAKNEAAVERLRELKRRPMKPFAVMMKDMKTVRENCEVLEGQEEYLDGWQKPILLLGKRSGSELAQGIAPDNPTVGVMLPYAPVQMLLFDYPDGVEMTDCLVMTSGNVSGAPICRSDEDAMKEISGFCDLMLSHNRKIRLRADDSVCDWLDGKPYMIRRSRGFAPLPIMFEGKEGGYKQAVAIGGELKNCFCIARGGLLYPSPYVGDMADIRTVAALKESVRRMCGLLECEPEVIVCDSHPRYNTVAVAEELAQEMGLPLMKVQHHYAHILSCMAENGYDGRVIGLSFDGTGYGDDGTIWGGEILLSSFDGYERAGSVEPFLQTGGDLSSKEGWRIASAILRAGRPETAEEICGRLGICGSKEYKLQSAMAARRLNTVTSTSAGRIFDAVSAVLGIRRASTFEGEASTALMFRAEGFEDKEDCGGFGLGYRNENGRITLETTELVCRIAEEYDKDPTEENARRLAYIFHKERAGMSARACEEIRARTGDNTCALSGGVFQNRLLVKLMESELRSRGFEVLRHGLIPPNDGGIALGQAVRAIRRKK